jgi:hypothetical protein
LVLPLLLLSPASCSGSKIAATWRAAQSLSRLLAIVHVLTLAGASAIGLG